jgi:hypothetical protein
MQPVEFAKSKQEQHHLKLIASLLLVILSEDRQIALNPDLQSVGKMKLEKVQESKAISVVSILRLVKKVRKQSNLAIIN